MVAEAAVERAGLHALIVPRLADVGIAADDGRLADAAAQRARAGRRPAARQFAVAGRRPCRGRRLAGPGVALGVHRLLRRLAAGVVLAELEAGLADDFGAGVAGRLVAVVADQRTDAPLLAAHQIERIEAGEFGLHSGARALVEAIERALRIVV